MAPRAHWKGFLKLSLVSCPITLYPAISAAERVSFRQVNRPTGNRLRHQLVDSVTGDVVPSHDKGRGYEFGERQVLLVQDEELEAAQQQARSRPYAAVPVPSMERLTALAPVRRDAKSREDSKRKQPSSEEAAHVEPPAVAEEIPAPVRVQNNRTIEMERFIPHGQIDPRYLDTPYYIAPRDEVGQEAFAVIRDVMRGKEMVGMGRVVLAKRERPIIMEPMGSGLCGMTLRYAHEVRSEAEYFAGIPDLTLPDEMLQVAEHILERKTADFDPAFLEDRYRTVLVSMLREKQAELPKRAGPAAPSPQNVIDLMDILRRSLESERPSSPRKPMARRVPAAKSTPKRATAQPRKADR